MGAGIGARTQTYALIGERLDYSLSPMIHNAVFAREGLNALYITLTIGRERLSSLVDVLRHGFSGFNVTIPFKERIVPYLDEIDESARVCGAVNTVRNDEGVLKGFNTDGFGILQSLREAGVPLEKGSRVVIVGNGGAAHIAGTTALGAGARVTFLVRRQQGGEAILASMRRAYANRQEDMSACTREEDIPGADLLINCTPVGMTPHTQDCPVSDRLISCVDSVFDAVYNPRETLLLRKARDKGIRTVEGLGMLFYQALRSDQIWLGEDLIRMEAYRDLYLELCKTAV